MSYEAEISRNNPSAFLFLIDMSGSMTDPYGSGKRKADGVADAINKLLTNLSIKCTKSEGVRDYYDVGVISYGKRVEPALVGELTGVSLASISSVANHPARVEERTKKEDGRRRRHRRGQGQVPDLVRRQGRRLDADVRGVEARAHHDVRVGCEPRLQLPAGRHQHHGRRGHGWRPGRRGRGAAFAGDAGRQPAALQLPHLGHVQREHPVRRPRRGLPDQFAKLLFTMSSVLPEAIRESASREGSRSRRSRAGSRSTRTWSS
jgi:hypothetical protein